MYNKWQIFFSALTLLIAHHEEHSAHKNICKMILKVLFQNSWSKRANWQAMNSAHQKMAFKNRNCDSNKE